MTNVYAFNGRTKSVTELKPVTKNGKYITGGKLVILKNGKKYDINGTEIK